MGKTADLAMVQKTIIDTLHKEEKSQRVITERGGCSRSAVSKHIKCKVDRGRNWVGKCAQATGMTASLIILSSNADSNTWESFTRSELKLESVHQESPCSDIFCKRATKPLLKQKHRQKHLTCAKEKKNWTVAQWPKVLFSDESTFCISFGNQEKNRHVYQYIKSVLSSLKGKQTNNTSNAVKEKYKCSLLLTK